MPRTGFILGGVVAALGVGLNYRTIVEYLTSRTIQVHWTYVVTGGFLVLVGAELVVGAFLQKLIIMYEEVLQFRRNHHGPARPV
jgi:hypothetical protein